MTGGSQKGRASYVTRGIIVMGWQGLSREGALHATAQRAISCGFGCAQAVPVILDAAEISSSELCPFAKSTSRLSQKRYL